MKEKIKNIIKLVLSLILIVALVVSVESTLGERRNIYAEETQKP